MKVQNEFGKFKNWNEDWNENECYYYYHWNHLKYNLIWKKFNFYFFSFVIFIILFFSFLYFNFIFFFDLIFSNIIIRSPSYNETKFTQFIRFISWITFFDFLCLFPNTNHINKLWALHLFERRLWRWSRSGNTRRAMWWGS